MDRRRFLAATAATAASAVLAACGDDEPATRPVGLAPADTATLRPSGALVTRWRNDPFAFGSYSYLAPGSSPADRVALAASVRGRLYFAGEATSVDHAATVHGALLSGRGAAAEIIDTVDAPAEIIVVGAGAAGLGAARELADAGFVVTIVEGRDRIGGRVHTDTSLGVPIELGAAWIHGADGNPLTELAERFEIPLLVTDPDEIVVYDTDGKQVDDDTLDALEAGLHELDFSAAPTVGETIDAALAELDPDDARLGRYLATAIIEHEEAVDVDLLSPETFVAGEEFGGDENVMPTGYIDVLAPLADGIDVQLGRTVTSISDDADTVVIEFGDDTTLVADVVLVTVPLGVLKAGAIRFEPPLPDDKLAAIDRLGMGVLDRVVLEFDEVFWDDDVEVIGFVGNEPGLFVEWYDWTRVVGKPIIVGFNAGSTADRIEALDDEQIIELATSALATIYS
jgi:polyamine oxidase